MWTRPTTDVSWPYRGFGLLPLTETGINVFLLASNGLEGTWSHFKRQVFDAHHWISGKHLDRYLEKKTFRFNRCTMGEGSRVDALLGDASGRRLTYKALIA